MFIKLSCSSSGLFMDPGVQTAGDVTISKNIIGDVLL